MEIFQQERRFVILRGNLVRVLGGVSVVALAACSFGDANESSRTTETMQTPSVVRW